MTDVGYATRAIVATVKENGGDLEKFKGVILALANSTAREISYTLDERATAQLKAALQFLYGLVDGTEIALSEKAGTANPADTQGPDGTDIY